MMRVGVVAVAAVLAALSAALILSFGISALGQPEGLERIFKVLIATAAGFAFFLVGRAVWRDMRRRPK
jgi:SNF family Na+-dependent transporter